MKRTLGNVAQVTAGELIGEDRPFGVFPPTAGL